MKLVSMNIPESLVTQVKEMMRAHLKTVREEVKLLQAQLKAQPRTKAAKTVKPEPAPATVPAQAVAVPTLSRDDAYELLVGVDDLEPIRMKKAVVQQKIVAHLRKLNGHGIGTNKLVEDLGTSYSTTFRALKALEENHVVTNTDSRWKLAQ